MSGSLLIVAGGYVAWYGAGGFLAVLAVLLGLDLITRRRSLRAPHQAEAPPGSAETERREPDEERA